jgi:hypothetical protein
MRVADATHDHCKRTRKRLLLWRANEPCSRARNERNDQQGFATHDNRRWPTVRATRQEQRRGLKAAE